MSCRLKTVLLPPPNCLRIFPARQARLATLAGAVADAEPAVAAPAEEEPAILRPVDRVISARVVFDADGEASVEYLAKWKEDGQMTWEPTPNLSEDLIRDFEEAFWKACKSGDAVFLAEALQYGGATAANLVNSEGRAPLHFAAALNNGTLCQQLIDAGALVDVQDPEGYTPLHMAAGYLHSDSVNALLAGGADMTRPDRQGRDVCSLVDTLRGRMTSAAAIQQRMRLEEVAKALTYFQFEDVAPAAVLRKRTPAVGDDSPVMYLISWRDDSPDSWVPEEFVSDEVKEDFEAGLEYAEAAEILDSRDVEGDCGREYLLRWTDGRPESWEDEDNVVAALVQAFEAERRRGGGNSNGNGNGGSGGEGGTGEGTGNGGPEAGAAAAAEAAPAISR